MAKVAPTGSQIRSAKRQAIGGARKRCQKGKSCSATCIAANEDCLVELPEPLQQATTKVAKVVEARKGGSGAPIASGGGGGEMSPEQQMLKTAAESRVANAKEAIARKEKFIAMVEKSPKLFNPATLEDAKRDLETLKGDLKKAEQELQDKFFTATGKAPAKPASRGLTPEQDERVDAAAAKTDRKIMKNLNERQFYDDETNAKIRAANEERMAPFMKMSADEKAALALYGQDGVQFYKQVNQMLRSGQMEDSTPDKVNMANFISKNLRAGLEKLPPAEAEELNRAVSGGFATSLSRLKPGDVIQDNGFGSYTNNGAPTLNQFMRSGEDNAVIRILNPKTARQVAPVMEYDTEGEHISLPGSRYRLVDVQPKGAYSRKVGDVPLYVFEEVTE